MSSKPWIEVRGVYGGLPESMRDIGLNAVWLRSDTITTDIIERIQVDGARVFAEFNSMHRADFVAENPDSAPVGADGLVSPPPDGWQGVCPTHDGYRRDRMAAFERLLTDFDLDGVWLDYHHAHASWEQAEPNLPDTCFCNRCLSQFARETGIDPGNMPNASRRLLTDLRAEWTAWRCAVFTDWVREYAEIRDRVRPQTLLGTFHCPWTDIERDGALAGKLAIDLRAQAKYVDVFSIMPYHARFGHARDIAWISRQVEWLANYLGAGKRIWPIVQLSDWGETVDPADVRAILDAATQPPSTGVMAFSWGSFGSQTDKVEAMGRFYRELVK